MAKNQVAAGANKGHDAVQAPAVPGTKKKRCPLCETEQGNASTSCSHCKAPFEKKGTGGNSTSKPSTEQILRFIVKNKSVDAAIAALEKVKADPAMSFAVLFGSAEKAITAVKREANRE